MSASEGSYNIHELYNYILCKPGAIHSSKLKQFYSIHLSLREPKYVYWISSSVPSVMVAFVATK